jgi:hypothetical protein
VKLSELITIKKVDCSKCFSILYALPYQIDKDIVNYLKYFGNPLYPINSISLIKIEISGGFVIESKIGSKVLKFSMPTKFKDVSEDKIVKKHKLEQLLAQWLSSKLKINITKD